MRGPLPDRSIPPSGSIGMSDDDCHERFRIQQQIQALVSKVSGKTSSSRHSVFLSESVETPAAPEIAFHTQILSDDDDAVDPLEW